MRALRAENRRPLFRDRIGGVGVLSCLSATLATEQRVVLMDVSKCSVRAVGVLLLEWWNERDLGPIPVVDL
eukprot:1497590-Prorocentrum_lima.AAC.1